MKQVVATNQDHPARKPHQRQKSLGTVHKLARFALLESTCLPSIRRRQTGTFSLSSLWSEWTNELINKEHFDGSVFHALVPGHLNAALIRRSWAKISLIAVAGMILVGSAFIGSGEPVQAAPNEQLNFQARLLNDEGGLVPDGFYNVQFNIYSGGDGDPTTADETLEWTGTHMNDNSDAVRVANGYLSVQLGSSVSQVNTLADVDWNNSTLWLSINIGDTGSGTTCSTETNFNNNCGGDGEMDPFMRLSSVPYAFNSNLLDGRDSTEYVQLNPGSTPQAVNTANAAIAVNQQGAGNLLRLQGSGNDVLTFSTGGTLTMGNSSTAGTLTLYDGTSNTGAIALANFAGNYTLTIPNPGGADTFCLVTLNNCSLFTDASGFAYLTDTADSLYLGGATAGAADILLGADGSAIFNEQSNDADFRIESDNDTHMFFVDASTDRIGVNISVPTARLHVREDTDSSGAGGGRTGVSIQLQDTGNSTSGTNTVVGLSVEATRTLTGGGGANLVLSGGSVTSSAATNGAGSVTSRGLAVSATGTTTNGSGVVATTGLEVTATGNTTGTSTATGLNVSVSGADVNYAAVFTGGYVGVGTSQPGILLDVDSETSTSDTNILRVVTDVGGDENTVLVVDSDGDLSVDGGISTGGSVRLTAAGVLQNVTNANADTFFTAGQIPIADGGTGASTAQGAINAIAGLTTTGDLLYYTGGNATRLARGSDGECLTSNATTIIWGSCAAGSSNWTDTGTLLHPADGSGDEDVAIGGTTAGGADIFFQGNGAASGSAVFNEQGNDADFRVESDNTSDILFVDAGTDSISLGSTSGSSTATLKAGTGGISIGDGGIANTLQFGNTTGAVSQSINIGNNATASSTSNVTIGSTIAGTVALQGPTTITGRTSGSATALLVNNNTSTGSIFIAQDNGSAVFTIADGGAITATSTLAVQGASVSVGTGSATNGALVLRNSTNGFTISINAPNQTTGSATISMPDTAGVDDTFCLVTLANCSGVGSSNWTDGGSYLYPADLSGAEDIVIGGTTTGAADIWLQATGAAIFNEQSGDADFRVESDNTSDIIFVDASADTLSLGSTNSTAATSLLAGTGGINIGTGGIANTVQIGTTTGAVTQSINIGNNATASSTSNVTIGSTVAGTVALQGPSTITGRTSGSATTLIVNNSTSTGSIFIAQDNGSAVFTIQNGGDISINGIANFNTDVNVSGNAQFDLDLNADGDILTSSTIRITETGVLQNVTNANADTFFTAGQIPIADGGTGASTAQGAINAISGLTTNGDLLYHNGTNSTRLARGSNGECLTSNATTIVWGSCSAGGGVTTVGTIDSQTKSADGAVISGTTIYLQNADADDVGLVSTGTQTFAGNKTFSGTLTVANITPSANLTIGTSDTTGTLLVLDDKTGSGDPTGVEGGMYYNSNTDNFRCYQDSAWRNCMNPVTETYLCNPGNQAAMCQTFTNLGASYTEVSNSNSRNNLDLSGYTEFRVQTTFAVAATTGDLRIDCDSSSSYASPSTLYQLDNPGAVWTIGAWTDIPSGECAAADVYLRAGMLNGNGTEDPAVRSIRLQFR